MGDDLSQQGQLGSTRFFKNPKGAGRGSVCYRLPTFNSKAGRDQKEGLSLLPHTLGEVLSVEAIF